MENNTTGMSFTVKFNNTTALKASLAELAKLVGMELTEPQMALALTASLSPKSKNLNTLTTKPTLAEEVTFKEGSFTNLNGKNIDSIIHDEPIETSVTDIADLKKTQSLNPTPKRKRRTKAELAAATGSTVETAAGTRMSPDMSALSAEGESLTAATVGTTTLDDAKKKLASVNNLFGIQKARETLLKFGVERFSEIKQEQATAFIALCDEVIGL